MINGEAMSAESESAPFTILIANLPPGSFWTRKTDAPVEECARAIEDLMMAKVPGAKEWMTQRRMVN